MIQIQWNSASQEEAETIVKALLENKLIACANLAPVTSHYIWKGKYHKDPEVKAYAKTTNEKIDLVFNKIQELTSYEVCEILAFDVVSAAAPYLCWVEEMVGSATLSIDEFKKISHGKDPYILLDVRTQQEYDEGHLEKAQLFGLSDQEIQDLLAWRKKNPHAPICLICHSGRRSLLARHQLRAMGFETIFSIEGGTEACKASGMTTVSHQKQSE